MDMLRLSIHQTFAQIGIQTTPGQQQMESPRGDLEIHQEPASMQITSPNGDLEIDSSQAWAALGQGNHFEWLKSIYSQMDNIALQAIAKIVEDGNRMADFRNPSNAFADLAAARWREKSPIQYVGEASNLNVKVHYEMRPTEIEWETHKPDIRYTPVKPNIYYSRETIEMYLRQKNTIDIRLSE